MGGHIGGAHYTPAVSFGLFLRRKIGATDLVEYWIAQLTGAALAFTFAYLVSGHTPGIHPGPNAGAAAALAVEIAFTAALVLVVLNVSPPTPTQRTSFYGLPIGFVLSAAAFVGGP